MYPPEQWARTMLNKSGVPVPKSLDDFNKLSQLVGAVPISKAQLAEGVFGQLTMTAQKADIVINESLSEQIQRIAMAHAIGYLAYNGLPNRAYTITRDCFNVKPKSSAQQFANLFMLELLVPMNLMDFLIMKKNYSLEQLQKFFDVNDLVMKHSSEKWLKYSQSQIF